MLLLSLALISGCDIAIPQLSGCPSVAVDYLSNHDWQDTQEFSKLDLETQYTIFICGQQRMGPLGRPELSEAMAMEGAPAEIFLRHKLVDARDDLTIRDVIFVLTLMQLRGTFRISDDPGLIELLRTKAASIRYGDYRRMVEGWIAEVENSDSYGRYRLPPSTSTAARPQ